MRIYDNKKDDWKDLRIKPEGWENSIHFYKGDSSCGQAHRGISVNINNEAGGVMTLDDLLELRDFINEHFKTITNTTN